jgi:hypothetical protein
LMAAILTRHQTRPKTPKPVTSASITVFIAPCYTVQLTRTLRYSSALLPRRFLRFVRSNHVVLTTTDSNTWGGASGHANTFTRRSDTLTDIDVVVVRDGETPPGMAARLAI